MPSIDENFSLVKYIIKKNLNGDLPDASFNMLINQAQYSYLSHLLGGTETYQPGRPISRVEIGNNQHISQKLSPFIDTPSTLTVDASGNSNFPTDLVLVNAMYKTDMSRIRFVQQDSLYSYLQNPIDPVANNPIFLIEKTKFQFYPITLGTAKISYVKKPTAAKWNFTEDANGRHIYNPTGSQNLLWADIDQWEIIARVLRLIGVHLNAQSVSQLANEVKTIGQ